MFFFFFFFFFCFCETKLKEHKISSAFTITEFRKDNVKTGDGGIIVYVRKKNIKFRVLLQ